jgi:putative colanic acid biosynthesis UDP-glucose lipid carrier transferase
MLGKLAEISGFVRREKADVIFIALPMRHIERVMNLLDDLRDSTASIYYLPDVFFFDLIQSRTSEIEGMPVVAMCETPFYGYRGVQKRATDVGLALLILVLALPAMLIIAVVVKLTSRGPAIFRQRRYGLDGKEIVVYKFRSMRVAEDGAEITQATRGDPRITGIGRILRRFSLDELPQLVNVLQGRMSLVGPRPHAIAHNEMYRKLIKGYMVRHKVLPGITGLAQVSGCRGETQDLAQMQARVAFDLDYLRHWSPSLDLRILFLTIRQMLGDAKAY